jgi:hypothetical protein
MGDPPIAQHLDLQISEDALARLSNVVDSALEVQPALEVARRRGRVPAFRRLKGQRVLRRALTRASGAKQRDIDVIIDLPGSKKKRPPRPGRPTGWPSLKQDRERVAARSLELIAFPDRRRATTSSNDETSGQVVHLGASSDDAYVPAEDEMCPLRELTLQVASATGINPAQMPPPCAFISMVTNGGSSWVHREGHGETTSVTVSLAHNTASIEFRSNGQIISPPPLNRGQALLFDPSSSHRLPVGDFRRVITFDLDRG